MAYVRTEESPRSIAGYRLQWILAGRQRSRRFRDLNRLLRFQHRLPFGSESRIVPLVCRAAGMKK